MEVLPALCALLVTAALAPLVTSIGRRWKALDPPGGRKRHDLAVPRTGGLAVLGGLLAGVSVALVPGVGGLSVAGLEVALPFMAAILLIFGVGLLDDIRGCSVRVKLTAQVIAGLLVVGGGNVDLVSKLFGPVDLGVAVSSVITILWLAGMANAMNFVDGLDGLAAGIGGVIAGSLAVVAGANGHHTLLLIALVLCGSCFGLLPFNWRPAKVFLGDSGSMTIGFALGCLSLVNSLEANTTVALLSPPLLLVVPATDALLVILYRFTRRSRAGLSVRLRRTTQADRHHLHHRLLAVAEYRSVVVGMHGLVVAGCAAALLALMAESLMLAFTSLLAQIAIVAYLRRSRHRKLGRALVLAGARSRYTRLHNPTARDLAGAERMAD